MCLYSCSNFYSFFLCFSLFHGNNCQRNIVAILFVDVIEMKETEGRQCNLMYLISVSFSEIVQMSTAKTQCQLF